LVENSTYSFVLEQYSSFIVFSKDDYTREDIEELDKKKIKKDLLKRFSE